MQDIKTAILYRELRAYVAQKRMEQRMLEERYNPYHSSNAHAPVCALCPMRRTSRQRAPAPFLSFNRVRIQ